MRVATRRSLNTVHGERPALRRRLPSSCVSVGKVPVRTKLMMQGACRVPVGEYLLLKTVPQVGSTAVLGRPVSEDNCKVSPLPVMILNGRPEMNSTSGANVQSLKQLLAKPSPESFPVWYTPLNTNRWR